MPLTLLSLIAVHDPTQLEKLIGEEGGLDKLVGAIFAQMDNTAVMIMASEVLDKVVTEAMVVEALTRLTALTTTVCDAEGDAQLEASNKLAMEMCKVRARVT